MNEEWKWFGEEYAKNSSSQQQRAFEALNQVGLKANCETLDLGCGDGKITYFIAKNVYPAKTIGLDKDFTMIEKAKEFEKQQLINLHFIQTDVRDFHLDQQFDLITSFFCLQWLPKEALLDIFRNIFKHLKEEGKICILLPCYDFPHEIIKEVAFSDKWKAYFNSYHEPQAFLDISYYNKILEQADFNNNKVISIESKHSITDVEFINFTRQWCGCYAWLKDEKQQIEFIQDILSRLSIEKHTNEGKLNMVQKSLQITAQKPVLFLSKIGYRKT